jgi:hypothetical protein
VCLFEYIDIEKVSANDIQTGIKRIKTSTMIWLQDKDSMLHLIYPNSWIENYITDIRNQLCH